MKVSFFLPVRSGSERVLNKNTRKFSNWEGGLLELKLTQLMTSQLIYEVLLSTNDQLSKSIARNLDPQEKRIRVIDRPQELCKSTTDLVDLIRYVPSIISADHILWGHTTTPFVDGENYDKCIDQYKKSLEEGFDSLVSVQSIRNFLVNPKTGKLINSNLETRWPRTQDLQEIFEINHAVFLTSRDNYIHYDNRIGIKPYYFVMDKIQSMDVDWEDDFYLAQALYESRIKL